MLSEETKGFRLGKEFLYVIEISLTIQLYSNEKAQTTKNKLLPSSRY